MTCRDAPRLTQTQIGFFSLCIFAFLCSLPAHSTHFLAGVSAQPSPVTPPALGAPTNPISSPASEQAPSDLSPSDAPLSPPSSDNTPIESPQPAGLTSCIGSPPLQSAFYCGSNGYWTLGTDLTVGSGGLLKILYITGPTLVMGTVTVKEDGKVIVILPLNEPNFPRFTYAMLRSTECINLGGSIDIQATAAAVKAANQTTLQNREYFLFDSPNCDVFLEADESSIILPFNDSLVEKGLPLCAVVKAKISFINASLPAFDNTTEIQGNASRRFLSAYVTWYHDCLGFYTKVLIPSIFGGILAILLLILVPMVFYTPKCCLDAKEREYRKKRKARHEEEKKAMLRGSGDVTSDDDYAVAHHREDVTTDADDVEKGTKGSKKSKKSENEQETATDAADSANPQTPEKKKRKWNPKAILTAPSILLPGRHYHIDKEAAKNKPKKKVTIQHHEPAKRTSSPQTGPARHPRRDSGKDDDDFDNVDDHDENQEVRMVAIPTVHSRESDFDSDSSSRDDSSETKDRKKDDEEYEDERDREVL